MFSCLQFPGMQIVSHFTENSVLTLTIRVMALLAGASTPSCSVFTTEHNQEYVWVAWAGRVQLIHLLMVLVSLSHSHPSKGQKAAVLYRGGEAGKTLLPYSDSAAGFFNVALKWWGLGNMPCHAIRSKWGMAFYVGSRLQSQASLCHCC